MKKQDAEKLLLAMTSVYAWVASADAGADVDEFKKFSHVILESPFATHFTEEDMRHTYKDMVELFRTNFEYALNLTKERIGAVKANPMVAEELLRLARAALVADGKLDQAEDNVINQIQQALQ